MKSLDGRSFLFIRKGFPFIIFHAGWKSLFDNGYNRTEMRFIIM